MTVRPLPPSRQLLFALLLTSATLLLLIGGLELALRLAGYGHSPHFAEKATSAAGEKLWRENRWCTVPFFSPALVRRPLPFRLPEKKAPGTYRIFVLGSSAAMGDPEPSFSLARTLETMLRAAYPQQSFEVVNAGITAINSHVMRGVAADCAQLEPDLFIVYEGNNEVIGPFGPAGVFAPFLRGETAVQAFVWLQGTRTAQLARALSRRFTGRADKPATWGGMQMFLQQQIGRDDPRLAVVRTHFRANLLAVAAAADAAGARTLLCTVATNRRDFAPFLSTHRDGLTSTELAAWQVEIDAAGEALRNRDPIAATRHYRAALAIDDRHAETSFRLGRLALQQGDDATAREQLARARDLDALRFRTDAALNRIIRELAASGAPGLEVIDLERALDERSAHGIAGDEFLYEHVHLTLRGTYESAAALFPHIVADLARRRAITDASAVLPSYDEARLRLAFTAHEQAMISLELLNRFRSPPFTAQSDHAQRLAAWQKRADQATALLQRPEALPALREVYSRALALAPADWMLARNAGAMYVARQAPAEALPLLERATALVDTDVDTWMALGWAHRALQQPAESAAAFARARALEPAYPGLPPAE